MVRLRKEIHNPGETFLDLAPDSHMVAPGVALLPLGVGGIRGNDIGPPVATFLPLRGDRLRGGFRPNDRPVTLVAMPLVAELLIHLRSEDLYGSRHELGNLVGGAGRSGGVEVPRAPVLLATRQQHHHRLHIP